MTMRVVVGAVVGVALLTAGAAPLPAQSTVAPRTTESPTLLTLALVDVALTDALESLSRAAQINLVWQARSLGDAASTRVSCRVRGEAPEVLLRCITRAAGLDYYRLSTGTYVVIGASEVPPGYASLAGTVVDAESGAPVLAARVELAERADGVRVDDDGRFRFARLRPGRYELSVRALGYRAIATSFELDINGMRQLRIPMQRSTTVQRPLIVQGTRVGDVSAQRGTTALEAREMNAVSGPMLWVPGIVAPLGASRRDGLGDLHVQGGDIGEHPWRLDGVPLYDVSTLSGLVGVVSPIVVDRMHLRRAGFRASQGSFAAGVVDMTHALGGAAGDHVARGGAAGDGAGGGAHAEAALDPLSATVRIAAPVTLGSARGRAMLAARTGLWSLTAPAAMVRAVRHWSVPDPVLLSRVSGFAALPGMEQLDRTPYATSVGDPAVRVGDVHGATRLAWGAAHELSVSGFSSSSGVRYEGLAPDAGQATLATRDDYAWRTMGAQASHRWLLGTRVWQTVQLRGSRHSLEHETDMRMTAARPGDGVDGISGGLAGGIAGGESNAIGDATLAASWTMPTSRVDLAWGVEGSHTTARLDLQNRVLRPLAMRSVVWRGALFGDVTVRLAPALLLETGARVTQVGAAARYVEPRLALRGESRRAGTPWSWRVAGGGYNQYVSQFDVATTMPVAFVPSLRFWMPADGQTPVARSWHLAGEAAWRVAPHWEVRVDAYSRWQPALPLVDYGVMYDATKQGQPVGAEAIRAMSGAAQGVGVRAVHDTRVRTGAWRTELAYDAGWAWRRFPSRFAETRQPPPWLEPQRLLLATELTTGYGLRVGVRARRVMQRPWALRQAYYDLFGAAPDNSGLPLARPGVMRRPAIMELDAGASWRFRTRGVGTEIAFSLTNALDRANVLDYGLRRRANGNGYDMVPRLLPGRQPALTVHIGS